MFAPALRGKHEGASALGSCQTSPKSLWNPDASRVKQFSGLPPYQRTLLAKGFHRATVTRFRQDGGIDVKAYAGPGMWAIKDLLIQTQAKRWLHTVGRKDVAELRRGRIAWKP
jgi:hypothetical protein